MRLKKELKQESLAAYLRDVEKTVLAQWPEQLVKIVGEDGRPAALLLTIPIANAETAERIRRAVRQCPALEIEDAGHHRSCGKGTAASGLSLMARQKPVVAAVSPEGLPDSEQFRRDLAATFAKGADNRLPFAVVLMRPKWHGDPGEFGLSGPDAAYAMLVKRIACELDQDDRLYRYTATAGNGKGQEESETLALILSATGMQRARQRAEKIRRSVKLGVGGDPRHCFATLSIGLGATSFDNSLSQADFLGRIEMSLSEACIDGDSVHSVNETTKGKSCQVTAEERLQLFKWLRN